MGIGRVGLLALVALAQVLARGSVKPGENIILNGRFESDQQELPPFWVPSSTAQYKWHPTGGPNGLPYVSLVEVADCEKIEVSIRQGGHKLAPGGKYRMSAHVRTRNCRPRSAGIVMANRGWGTSAGFWEVPEDTGGEWRQMTKEFTCFKGNWFFAALYVCGMKGELDIADVRLEAIDEKALAETQPTEMSARQNRPRLLPFAPLLEKIPEDDRRVTFRFFGKLPDGVAAADCEVTLAADDASEIVRRPFAADALVFALPKGAKEGILTASVVAKGRSEPVCASRFRFRTVKRPVLSTAGHRRLNNLTTEVLAAKLDGAGDFAFCTTRDGWAYAVVKGAATGELRVSIDGREVIAAATPRHETMRRLPAGPHALKVTGAGKGQVVVRQIADILSYSPSGGWIPENGGFGWGFQEKYVLPGLTTMNGGGSAKGHADFRARGYEWLGNLGAGWKTPEDVVEKLGKCEGLTSPHFDGVTCDELFFADPDGIDTYALGLNEFELRAAPERRICTWIVGKPSIPGIDHSLFASGVNASRGTGSLLFEAYCGTYDTEQEARANIDSFIGDTLRRYRQWYPLSIPSASVVLGNFTQIPILSLDHHPEVDFKYYLDMLLNYVANDASCDGIGGVGYWGSYYAEEELHRWSFALMRHYVIEGNTNMLSAAYGYSYKPNLLRNGDFRGGFDGWTTTGDVRADSHPKFAANSQGRWGGAAGDTFATLVKRPGEVASVSQRVTGLVPGRMYHLQYVTFDVRDVKASKTDPKPIALRARPMAGMEIDPSQTWSHVDRREKGRYARNNGVARVVINNAVFTAGKSETVVTIDNAEAKDGETLGVNYVRVLPYYPR